MRKHQKIKTISNTFINIDAESFDTKAIPGATARYCLSFTTPPFVGCLMPPNSSTIDSKQMVPLVPK